MTRDEHLAWAKKRALEYLDAGDLTNALSSMGSDLSKHDELRGIGAKMADLGLIAFINRDAVAMRRWIEGFR